MSLDREHLEYPLRRYGMDHDRYDWSMLADRKPVSWPGGARLALWVNVSLQFFPLNQEGKPFPPPGGMTMPYPDLRHYTLRDYGNRVGIYRLLDALASRGVKASFAVNGQLAERVPQLVKTVASAGEVIGHGWNMDTPHYGGLDRDAEAGQIDRTLDALRDLTGQAVSGWLSPGRNESENTPELLAERGVRYLCDWVNDDMPYPFHTATGELVALPLSTEIEDRFVLQNNLHSEQSWVEQVCDAGDLLLAEASAQGGRLLALSLHPWLVGQPHRIGKVEAVLDHLLAQDGVWSATPGEIIDSWQAQQ
jgi:peptidoglycan/xylan/chitin deacetylase (PgdA/CDA1 family)